MAKTPPKKTRDIERGIRLTWDSLQSHMPYMHGKRKDSPEGPAFHRKCVKEYAETLLILANQLPSWRPK